MGLNLSKRTNTVAVGDDDSSFIDYPIVRAQRDMQKSFNISLQKMVAHYTPSFCPMNPKITKSSMKYCRDSWEKITSKDVPDPYGGRSMSGLAAFYTEFYERLEEFDGQGKFEAVLLGHSGNTDKVAVKGSVLMRVINYGLSIEEEGPEIETALYLIGKAHTHRAIRPWMYSVFMQTLMNTLSSRLGNEATKKVMESWVNLFAYMLKFLLPPAIRGRVVETEMNINTSSAFAEGRVFAEVAELEEVKAFNRKIRSRGSSAAPSGRSSARSAALEPLGGPLTNRGRSGDDEDAVPANVKGNGDSNGNGNGNDAIESILLDSLHNPTEQLPAE